ncbi:MAG TPA: HAD family hydrolase [Acidimicrobiales bacterium]|nr:HAD family hydrolase [Acidimicrobiales bacterium]
MALALFDLDNTLIDRDAGFRLWAERFLAARGARGGEAAHELAWLVALDGEGLTPRPEFFDAVKARYDLREDAETLQRAYSDALGTLYRPDPAVVEALRALRAAGFKTAVITNGPASQEVKILSAGLHRVLDAWCISALEGAAKPERAIFEAAASRCGEPLEGWMVGDNPDTDIRGGAGAGLRTVWMARGRRWGTAGFEPDAVAHDVAGAAREILARSGGERPSVDRVRD